MAYKLSEGCLEVIMSDGQYEKPVIQVLETKKIQQSQGRGAEDRYRLLVSDGKYQNSYAMLSPQLNDKLLTGELSINSVVQLDRYITSFLKNNERKLLVILDLTVIAPGNQVGKRLGNPQPLPEGSAAGPQAAVRQPPPRPAPMPVSPSVPRPVASNLDSSLLCTQMTHPIASLSPYQNKWVIKARVMNKNPIRTWSNAKGEGKLFSMDLCDESGEIRATAFKNECDRFYDLIQVDRVYFISRCQLKPANKQFSNLKNDYEMTFTADTVVSECMDDGAASVPTIKFDFLPINEIGNKNPDSIVDVIGVCKMANDIQEVTVRSTGKLLKKRDVTLVDSSGGAISLTLWGSEAEKFDSNSRPVVAAKGARLTEFNGSKSLSCLSGTMLRMNPDIPEAHKLRGWYDNGGADMEVVNISARSGTFSGGNSEWLTFADAEAQQLGSGDKGDFFSLIGVVTFTFADNAVYKACPQPECNKKVVDLENGLYRCEKCSREYPNYKYRLLLAASVSDATGDQRVTAFNESAEVMLGQSAADVGRLFDYDKTAYTQLMEELKFKTFLFKLRTKMETYNDEARLKTTVVQVHPVNYKEANTRMLKTIQTITGIEV